MNRNCVILSRGVQFGGKMVRRHFKTIKFSGGEGINRWYQRNALTEGRNREVSPTVAGSIWAFQVSRHDPRSLRRYPRRKACRGGWTDSTSRKRNYLRGLVEAAGNLVEKVASRKGTVVVAESE